jgi:ATP/maltotriose-dependent transcriptional regulator MalT
MDTINQIVSTQLSEREVIIYLLIESGMSYRNLGERLGLSHTHIVNIYEKANKKMRRMAEAGAFQSQLSHKTVDK